MSGTIISQIKDILIKRTSHNKIQTTPMPSGTPITIPELLSACPEAAEFSLKRIETIHDVVAHARTLAPMIGISPQNYEAAHERLGALRAAATVWAIKQFHDKIKAVGAYFRSITTGSKSEGFSPESLIRRLASAQKYEI
ncbi:MAG: replication initiation protein RepC [Pseudoruegeria sp.]